ncbi:MAG: hypothetical protein GY705_11815 [Bacteroidetes bacterium]|nr:hypothetical protein [Bacteroidota bacterium]
MIDWEPLWSTGAPMPQVFSDGGNIYLIYLIHEPDPNWDGTYVRMIDNTSETSYPLALVEFDGYTFKFGVANDEVNHGLPLWNKGLKFYSAHEIENSNWIQELKKIHSVHPQFSEDRWKDLKHYVFLFHDELLEVICKGYKIEKFNTTFKKLAAEVVNRMNS